MGLQHFHNLCIPLILVIPAVFDALLFVDFNTIDFH